MKEVRVSSTKKKSGPIDWSGVFRTSDMEEEEEAKAPSLSSSTKPLESTMGSSAKTMPSWVGKDEKIEPPSLPPPNTPFFSSSTEEEAATTAAPPPNTPFFQSSNNGKEGERQSSQDKSLTGTMFGTYKKQRLQKLAKKVGTQMEEDMKELRRNMEGKS